MLSETITPFVGELGIERLEARQVQVLPDVEQHEVELARVGIDHFDRIAAAKLDMLSQPARSSCWRA
jgi:hypothetical protein